MLNAPPHRSPLILTSHLPNATAAQHSHHFFGDTQSPFYLYLCPGADLDLALHEPLYILAYSKGASIPQSWSARA